MARRRVARRAGRRHQSQPSKQERLGLFNDENSPWREAPERVKKYFVKNEELDDIDLEDFSTIFKEKKTKTNVCMYRINKDGDSE